jgi:hypothetical protein
MNIKRFMGISLLLVSMCLPTYSAKEDLGSMLSTHVTEQDVVLRRLEERTVRNEVLLHSNTDLLKATNRNMELLLERDRQIYGDVKTLQSKAVTAGFAGAFFFSLISGVALKVYFKEKE